MGLAPDQQAAIDAVVDWYRTKRSDEFRVGGLAGTGKTTIAAYLPKALGLRPDQVAYCAYTGKAAEVLRKKLRNHHASTIHQLIYRRIHGPRCVTKWDRDADCDCSPSFERVSRLGPTLRLIIVDEASMVDGDIYKDLLRYGVPAVWIGDHGQLPPITPKGSEPFNLMDNPDIKLEKIHRQKEGSPILDLAMKARRGEAILFGSYGTGPEEIDTSEVGSTTVFLCHTNANRRRVNDYIRSQNGYPPSHPVVGDRLICLRNNHPKGIVNGTTGTLLRGKVKAEIALDGEAGLYRGSMEHWDYAYCLTVHKAQGSEYARVVLVGDYRGRDCARWLYTAITRAKEQLTIIPESAISSW